MRDPLRRFVARTVRASAALQRRLVHYSLCFIYPGEISNRIGFGCKRDSRAKIDARIFTLKMPHHITFLAKSIGILPAIYRFIL